SFSTPRKILGPERYQVRMAIDQSDGTVGRIHLVWLESTTPAPTGGLPDTRNPILSAYSDDGGTTFSSPVQVSDSSRLHAVAPAVALGPNHTVDVVYYDLGADVRDYLGLDGPPWTASKWSLVATHSSDGGDHFSAGHVVDLDIAPPGRVMLIFTMAPASFAVDDSGRLFVAWHDARNGDWDVFLRRSTDAGQTWGTLERLNDDPLHDGRDQYLPRLSVSPSGRVDAIFYDRRGDTDNVGTNVYYTWSDDHGETFHRNLRINEVTFSSIVGPRYTVPSARGLIEFGSRIALYSTNTEVLAAWTDTSNTRAGVKAQDIAATEIDFASVSSPATALQWSGVSLAAIGVAGLVTLAWVWARSRRARPSRLSPRVRTRGLA
ncbi:MAG: exo-alpha-sialidase, partial [Candidatus Dormibacteraeota bacterium]|nr:exo-alpha-sialidase [Candidatus Dormibacteraeota bacterium]